MSACVRPEVFKEFCKEVQLMAKTAGLDIAFIAARSITEDLPDPLLYTNRLIPPESIAKFATEIFTQDCLDMLLIKTTGGKKS